MPRLAAGILLLASIHLLTLTISPVPWQDEVQIVDSGRVALSDDRDSGLYWTAAQRPIQSLNYLGPLLQESAYRLLAPSIAGPRLSAWLGALIAAWMLSRWLTARGVTPGWNAALTAVFLFDPIFVQGYRGARVDCWVFALVLAACIEVRRSGDTTRAPSERYLRCAIAAALAVAAFFVWPSAVYLLPLLIVEFITVHSPTTGSRGAGPMLLAGSVGLVLALALFLIPLGPRLPIVLADAVDSRSQLYLRGLTFDLSSTSNAAGDLARTYLVSALVPLIAIAGASRSRLLAVAAALVLAVIMPTMIFAHRVVYLLPYFIGIIGDATRTGISRPLPMLKWAVTGAVVWSAGISLIARPAQALMFRDARDPGHYERAADGLPEFRDRRIYLDAFEFYYAGRERGWRQVHAYSELGESGWAETFKHIDYALYAESAVVDRQLREEAGWTIVREITLPQIGATRFGWIPGPRRYFVYAPPR
jgi:hypothetical protein